MSSQREERTCAPHSGAAHETPPQSASAQSRQEGVGGALGDAVCCIVPHRDGDDGAAALVERTAEDIHRLAQRTALQFAYAVGEMVIQRFYGGCLDEWRRRGPKMTPVRALAARLNELGSVSSTTLYRYIALYEFAAQLGGVSALKHWSLTHVYAVLPLREPGRQYRLLQRAETLGWSCRDLQDEVAKGRHRGARRPAAGQPKGRRTSTLEGTARSTPEAAADPARRRAASLVDVAARVERDAALLLERLRSAPMCPGATARQSMFDAVMRAREALDAAQALVSPKRHAT